MYQKIQLSQIIPNPNNARKTFKDIQRLAESIKTVGLQQPIVVYQLEAEKYVVVAGERRFKACQLLKWHEVDCRVVEYDPVGLRGLGIYQRGGKLRHSKKWLK